MENFVPYYDVYPRVVPANQTTKITIRGRYPHSVLPEAKLMRVKCFPMSGFLPNSQNSCYIDDFPPINWQFENDAITAEIFFAGEQEHNLHIEFLNEAGAVGLTRRFQLFSVESDLFEMSPLKGDFHIHSNHSDGKEAPEYVAARYREEGFDFIAITDHHRYNPSIMAINYWQDKPIDLKLFPGEEVHSPNNPVHIINFGSSFSVNELAAKDTERYLKEVAAIEKTLPDYPGQAKFPVAASEWVFDQIRAGGGLCVFCHPYWKTSRYMINETLTDAMFERRKFDAFELLGGYRLHECESNNLQVVRWAEELSKGNRFPVVGLSDSHGSDTGDLCNWYYTIVLAKSDSFEDIKSAILNFKSVAVEAIKDQVPHIYGDFRMVKYVDFLLREYFPLHQDICVTEGNLMCSLLAEADQKSSPSLSALKALQGRSDKFRRHFFGR